MLYLSSDAANQSNALDVCLVGFNHDRADLVAIEQPAWD